MGRNQNLGPFVLPVPVDVAPPVPELRAGVVGQDGIGRPNGQFFQPPQGNPGPLLTCTLAHGYTSQACVSVWDAPDVAST